MNRHDEFLQEIEIKIARKKAGFYRYIGKRRWSDQPLNIAEYRIADNRNGHLKIIVSRRHGEEMLRT